MSILNRRPHPARRQRVVDVPRRDAKVAPAFRPRLVLFVKEPAAGRVKTRLARGLGAARATAFYRHATAIAVARLAGDPRWQTLLAVAPDAALASRTWTPALDRVAQGGGDLGKRLDRVMAGLPPGPVVIVGTDVVGMRPRHVARAFAALGRSDAVFGPAPDGGYWLVGLRRRPRLPRAFDDVRWSSEHALADTRANLATHDVATIDTLDDIDEAADHAAAAARGLVGRRI